MTPALRVQRHRLRLARPLATAAGTIAERTIWLVEAVGAGASGWGEAAPLPGFGGEAPERCELALARAAADPAAWRTHTAAAPCAHAACADACADLAARLAGRGLSPAGTVALNALAADDAAALAAAAAPAVKLKAGGDPVAEAARIRALLARHPGMRLRLDANGAWDLPGAHAFARLAGGLVEYVEQPLPARDLRGHAELRRAGLRIALDESLRGGDDLARALAAGACDVAVLKPNWLGGAEAAAGIAALAHGRAAVVLSHALGSGIERMHAARLALRLGLPGPHGLAGGLLAGDPAPLPVPPPWRLDLADGPGLGLAPRGSP